MTQSLNLVFCGTPRFAVPTLEKIVEAGHHIHLVVTQPDRPKGRRPAVIASPVKQSALRLNLPSNQPERTKSNEEFRAQLTAINPDAIIVAGYGRIIPQGMLDLAPLGNINLHASLLPKYRGAAPIQWAIANGETVTGNTTMRIDAGLDTGDILVQQELAIEPEDTSETLAPRLAAMGADLMVETLRSLQAGKIDFARAASEILKLMRGFQPWAGAHTKFRGKNLQILKAHSSSENLPMGELRANDDQLFVGCGQHTSLELIELQLEGKKRTSARDFLHGYRLQAEEKLGM